MATRLETRETTHSLIDSDKVDGTAVYGADQQKIGSIERVMIDKISGKVAYAVLSFGGFMGMGEDYYPAKKRRGIAKAKDGIGAARMTVASTTTIEPTPIGLSRTVWVATGAPKARQLLA